LETNMTSKQSFYEILAIWAQRNQKKLCITVISNSITVIYDAIWKTVTQIGKVIERLLETFVINSIAIDPNKLENGLKKHLKLISIYWRSFVWTKLMF
jgi:hypothetical protein